MKVLIQRTENKQKTAARILLSKGYILPSLTEGWRFNFRKNTIQEKLLTYVLVCVETNNEIEGCVSFRMRNQIEPYMAYIELAPHNKGSVKRYDRVAGCLIAFACRLSFIHAQGAYKGWLAFDVLEEKKEDAIKLTALYCKKYGAIKFMETTLLISPERGEELISEYLNNYTYDQEQRS